MKTRTTSTRLVRRLLEIGFKNCRALIPKHRSYADPAESSCFVLNDWTFPVEVLENVLTRSEWPVVMRVSLKSALMTATSEDIKLSKVTIRYHASGKLDNGQYSSCGERESGFSNCRGLTSENATQDDYQRRKAPRRIDLRACCCSGAQILLRDVGMFPTSPGCCPAIHRV